MKLALWGNFGSFNLGNECTLAAVIHSLRRSAVNAELTCICSEPTDTEARHGIRAIAIRTRTDPRATGIFRGPLRKVARIGIEIDEWRRAFSLATKIDALIIAGTGILTDDGEGTFGLPYELFKWSLVTRLCGGKLFFLSVGVESISTLFAKACVIGALRLANYRSYRDFQSKERLRAIGFPSDADSVYPDLAFSLPEGALRFDTHPRGSRAVIGVGIFNYRNRGISGPAAASAYRRYLNIICSFVIWLLERDYEVRVIMGDYAYDNAVRSDVRAELEARGVTLKNGAYVDEPAQSYEQVIEQLACVDLVVASRFHNVVLSLLLGKPVVSVSYDAKNDALMSEVGLGSYCEALDRFDLQALIGHVLDLEGKAAQLRGPAASRVAEYRMLLKRQYDTILEKLGVRSRDLRN